MGLTIRIGNSCFAFDDGWFIQAFGHELLWSSSAFVLDRPNGSKWIWTRKRGRWTEKVDGVIADGWV
jgi:hypothetical protein